MPENSKNSRSKQIPFLIALSYLVSLVSIRILVLIVGSAHTEFAQAAKIGVPPEQAFSIGRNIILFGHHIHHFYIGIALMALAGWFSIVETKYPSKKFTAVMYGAGLGLFFDEIGLLLTWGDYFSGVTYTLSLLIFGLFINIIFFNRFWSSLKENIFTTHPHNSIEEFLLKNQNVFNFIDHISQKTSKTSKVSLLFSAGLYFILTILVLVYPRFVRYWIAGLFIIHGLVLIPEIFTNKD